MHIKVWSVAAAVLLLAACSGPKPEVSGPSSKSAGPPDTSSIKIEGDASDPVNKIAIQAIADLEQYWGEQYPTLYNSDWEPVSGDLDEAIKALLVFRGDGDVERQGAGWARVKAFREGVINGAEACLNYQA